MKLLKIALALALLSGCAGTGTQNSGQVSDEMEKSPCACLKLDYDGAGYQWLS